jgi:hypothetical protein
MQNPRGWWAVIDGVEQGPYEGIEKDAPFFSHDSRHYAYQAWTMTGKRVLVVDGVIGLEFDEVQSVAFSPDSQGLAYVGRRGDKWRVVVVRDETKEEYGAFFVDSKILWDSQDAFHTVAARDGEFLAVEVEILRG